MGSFLQSRRGVAAIVALGVLLSVPSVWTGFVADDWFHELQLDHRWLDGMSHGVLDLFTFARGNADDNRKQMDIGLLPWWADSQARLSFFRPLASLTHVIDHAIAPGSAVVAHLQNLLWYGLAILAAAWVFRDLLDPRTAAIALFLFAVDQRHGPAVGWISNRHEMISIALALPALALHHRWRSRGWTPGVWFATLALCLGLLAGESAVAVTGYLAAYELHVDRASIQKRLLSLAPYAAVVVAWRIVYSDLGYGATHSGLYIDPAHQPARFLAAFPVRYLALLASQLAGPFSDGVNGYAYFSPNLGAIMTVIALLTVLAVAVAFAPVLRANANVRMFTTGMLLSIVPVCATFPADRLLFFAGVGGAALVGAFISTAQTGWRKPMLWGLVAIHVVISTPFLALRSLSMQTIDKPIERALKSLPPESVGRTVIIVNAPADPLAGYLALALASRDGPRPAHVRWIESGSSALEITRTDANTLTVHADDGFIQHETEQLLRSSEFPMHVGDDVDLTGVNIQVTAMGADAKPSDMRFRFSTQLEDSSLVWLQWDQSYSQDTHSRSAKYVRWAPPPVGQTIHTDAIDMLNAAFAKD